MTMICTAAIALQIIQMLLGGIVVVPGISLRDCMENILLLLLVKALNGKIPGVKQNLLNMPR